MYFSPDKKIFATAAGNEADFGIQIRIRRVDDWSLVKTLPAQAYSVALSPDGTLLVSTGLDTISMWGLPRR